MAKRISDFPPLPQPVGLEDLVEVSRPVEPGSDEYKSFKCPALVVTVGQATTSLPGIIELATTEEAIDGEDGERAITPQTLDEVIKDVLQNRIIQGTGMLLTYSNGTLTVAVA